MKSETDFNCVLSKSKMVEHFAEIIRQSKIKKKNIGISKLSLLHIMSRNVISLLDYNL